jgi:cytidylate kinase
MKTIATVLKEKGFIGIGGKADINALNRLSALTTIGFVNSLREHIADEKSEIEALSNIYEHLAFLYNENKDDEAVRFISVLVAMSDIALTTDVKMVLGSKTTKHAYLYEFVADFHDIMTDIRFDAGVEDDKDGEYAVVEYGVVAPSL